MSDNAALALVLGAAIIAGAIVLYGRQQAAATIAAAEASQARKATPGSIVGSFVDALIPG